MFRYQRWYVVDKSEWTLERCLSSARESLHLNVNYYDAAIILHQAFLPSYDRVIVKLYRKEDYEICLLRGY